MSEYHYNLKYADNWHNNPTGHTDNQARMFDNQPCMKNNGKCGVNKAMYYNEPHFGHHDYTKVEMPLYGKQHKPKIVTKVPKKAPMYSSAKIPYEQPNAAVSSNGSEFATIEHMGDMSGSYAQGLDSNGMIAQDAHDMLAGAGGKISVTDLECERCPDCKMKGKCDYCYSCANYGQCSKTDKKMMQKGGIDTPGADAHYVEGELERNMEYENKRVEGFGNLKNILNDYIGMDQLNLNHMIILAALAAGGYMLYQKYNGAMLDMQGVMQNRALMMLVGIVVVLLVVKVFMPDILTEGFEGAVNADDLEWEHKEAAEQVAILSEKYGGPKVLHKGKGGIAVWTEDQLAHTCFVRIEVLDEKIYHCKPAEHFDHTYHYINYDVSPEKFLDVTSLSGSVAYDPLKKWLRARCGSEEANIATLALATQIGEGNVTFNFVQGNEMYKAWIMSTKKAKNVKKLYELLCFNVRNQKGDPRSEGVWKLAFSDGC